MKITTAPAVLLVLLGVWLSGCGSDTHENVATELPVVDQSATSAIKGIDWFDGSVEQAFAIAASEDKPVFLYWGAECAIR